MARRVLAFGTFDVFHKGHESFLARAAELGELHVAVARDNHVRLLKQREPQRGEGERMATIARLPGVFQVHLSDETLGGYGIVQDVKPDVIALGHDQDALAADLERWLKETGRKIEVVRISKA